VYQSEFSKRIVTTEQEASNPREEKQPPQDQDTFLYKSAFIEGHRVIFQRLD
jgi:hypothetical protein